MLGSLAVESATDVEGFKLPTANSTFSCDINGLNAFMHGELSAEATAEAGAPFVGPHPPN